ncbi:MAG: hypothetical protein H6729_02365 [Deltaproteobacteria bacterium]|nr:hypothetical protein [Deltaproteobacteria bacterium]
MLHTTHFTRRARAARNELVDETLESGSGVVDTIMVGRVDLVEFAAIAIDEQRRSMILTRRDD